MVVHITNAFCLVSLPTCSKHYIFNQGLFDQYRLLITEHSRSFSSKRPTSFSTDTHLFLEAAQCSFLSLLLLTTEQLTFCALLQEKTEANDSVLQDILSYALQFPKSTGECRSNISNATHFGRWWLGLDGRYDDKFVKSHRACCFVFFYSGGFAFNTSW